MKNTFTANGSTWTTDYDTLVLMNEYRQNGNEQMLAAVFEIGRRLGRIEPLDRPATRFGKLPTDRSGK